MKKILLFLACAFFVSGVVNSQTISVTSPNGGETWAGCSVHSITWTHSGTSGFFNVEYSTDNGNSWASMASNYQQSSSPGSYSWTVPNLNSTQALVRVYQNGTPAITDQSNGNFTITPAIQVTSPNGGESWQVGAGTHNITWTSAGTSNFYNIDYSINAGSSWINIVTNSNIPSNTYTWTIPNNPSTQCLVRVQDYQSSTCKTDNSDALFTIAPPTPVMTVTAPNGGNTLYIGQSSTINWTSQYAGATVKIEYSTDNGSTWNTITASTSNNGSYTWTNIPNAPSNQCLIKVSDTGTPTTYDVSDAVFNIVLGSLTVTAPNGGESWIACSSQSVTWSRTGTSNYFNVYFSINGGTTWQALATNYYQSGSNCSYSWTLNNTATTQARVLVTDYNNSVIRDSSDANFTIVPAVTVTSPNGSETWQGGTTHAITWTQAAGASNYWTIQYSTDAGSNWNTIVNGSSITTGTYNWSVPNNPSVQCLVRVYDYYNSCRTDVSDNLFTIIAATPVITVNSPNGGNTYYVGGNYNITWSYQYVVGSFVMIEYSTNNGSSWSLVTNSTAINTGSYTWISVPNYPSAQCLVRVSEVGNPTVNDSSNAVFSIVYPYVIVSSPNGAESWNGCNNYTVSWTPYQYGSSNWKVEYSLNNGTNWNTIVSSTSGNSYSWFVPDTSSSQTLVKVTKTTDALVVDSSNAVFTINADNSIVVTSPNGGESWQVANPTARSITWTYNTSQAGPYFYLYYSTNGGTSWTVLNGGNYVYTPGGTGSYSWTIPNTPSTNVLVRIDDYYTNCKNDKSDAAFTIVAPDPVITVTSPNGGNTYYVNGSYNIQWTYSYVATSFVTIEYSTNNGTSWASITNSTSIGSSGSGSYTWSPVPNFPSNQCLIKVSEYLNPSVKDSSNSVFSIVYPYVNVTSPNTGVTWSGCTSQNITWNYYGTGSPNWNVQYSTDNGSSWISLANTTGSSYNWNPIPNTITSNQALVKVTNNADSLVKDSSDVAFSIVPVTYIILNSPNGGEVWEVNNPATRTIQWSYSGTTNYFNIYYSINGGSSWISIVNGMYAGTSGNGSYSWTIPNNPSTNCLVRVEDYYATCKYDQSDAVFTIQPPTPVITVTYPNGGNTFYVGSSYNIQWSYQYVAGVYVQIDYSINNGTSWLPVIASIPINTGSYSWNPVPNTPSTQCLVRVRSTIDTTITDSSNAVFNIVYPYVIVNAPNGGESWNGCSSQTISWTGYGAGSGPWKVEYSLNNGTSWSTLVSSTTSSSYNWNPVIDTAVTQALFKVTKTTDALVKDSSNAVFTINADNSILVNSPNGGENWQCNNPATQNITWTYNTSQAGPYFYLYYSTNGGSSWTALNGGSYVYQPGGSGSFTWTIPNNPSANVLVRIDDYYTSCKSDVSNGVFTIVAPTPVITVNYPNGGNTFYVGSSYNITWSYQYVTGSFVMIEYSTNNGSTWTQIINSTPISSGSYTWSPVPNTPSSQCLIRVSEVGNPSVNDVSNSVFSIVYPYVIVSSPNGGESWIGCSSQTISWTGYGSGSGPWKVEYTLDNGANWTTLVSSTTSSSYNWNPIPNTPSTQCLVRVTRTSDALVTDASNATFNITQNTAIVINSPNGGESWQVANPSSQNITWSYNTAQAGPYFYLYYSTNGGSSWTALNGGSYVYQPGGSGTFSWTIPNTPSTNVLVRIDDYYTSCKTDVSDAKFTILAPTPVITVSYPNGGNTFYVGTNYTISWTYQYVQSNFVTIEYSTNNGSTWNTIINSTAIGSNYTWNVPNTPSTQCLIKVSEYGNPSVYDVSNAVFNIVYPYITVFSPNGGETWNGCSAYNISWGGYGTNGPYMVEYSTDGGTNWATLISSTSATSYSWNPIPNTQYNNTVVRVSVVSNSSINDVSDASFTISQQTYIIVNIPNGGESWQCNNPATQIINWAFAGTSTRFNLYYSINGGTSWISIASYLYATGGNYSYTWTIPNNPSTNCLVKVEDYYNSCMYDDSDSPFTIIAPTPYITVTAPNGGNTLYSFNNYSITWTSGYLSSSFVKIDYSVDSGATWVSITNSTNNTGSYSWAIPNVNSTKCLVRVSDFGNNATYDISDAIFTIKPAVVVTAPNGGENVSGCTVTTITWVGESSSASYFLEYSLNGGSTWSSIVSQTFSGGPNFSYNWTLPNTPSNFCLVRVTNNANSNKVDKSDAVFSILPTITVTNPNNGGSFAIGSTMNITWTQQGVSNYYNIDYSTNGGVGWTNIAFNTFITTNTYAWVVENTPSTNCLIKVTDYQASCKVDQSDLAFTISNSPASITVTSPNGGENWKVCSTQNVTWSANSTSGVYIIEYSDDNGTTWAPLDSSYDTNSGTFSWTLGDSATSQGLIRVKDSSNTALVDQSNSAFTVSTLSTPGAISGSSTVCEGSTQTYSIALVTGATSYTWTLPSGWAGSSTSNTITVTAGATTGTVSVVANNSCSSSSASNLNVTVTPLPATPGSITGNTTPCSGVSQTYSISTVSGATSYTWILPSGYSGSSTNTNINVTIGTGSGDILVASNNSCGSSANSTLTITPSGTSLPNQPGNISGPASPCVSSSQTYSVVPVSGATSYTWTLPSGWTGTSTTEIITVTVGSAGGSISVTANNSCGSSSAQARTLNITNVPAQPGTITGSSTVCQGTTNTYSISSVSGATNYTWTLPSGWTGSSASTSIVTVAAGSSGNITVSANNTCGSSTVRTLAVTVNTPATPSVSIAQSPAGAQCFNTNITFTATPVNGGAPPAYQWYKNGVAVGLNAVTYSNSSWSNNDSVWVVMTTSLSCVTLNAVSSNKIGMTINSNTPAISISADTNSICAGTTVNFTSSITNGGSSPAYQWKKNGSNISGATSSTYSTSVINNTDAFSCVLTSNVSCATSPTATSNTILITVTQYVNPLVTISSDNDTICTGQNVTFTATPSNGGTSPGYQWRKNGIDISSQTATTYFSTAINDQDTIDVIMTSNSICLNSSADTSNQIVITVPPTVTPGVSIIIVSPDDSICSGTSVTFTATPTYGGNIPSYQWMKNGVDVSGANSSTYTTTTLVNTDVVTVVMTSAEPCPSPSTATSNAITMTVFPNLSAGVTISANIPSPVCNGTEVIFTAVPSNGGATPSYQWQINNADVVGETGTTFTADSLENNDTVAVVMSTSEVCTTPSLVTSNNMIYIVNNLPAIPIISASGPTTFCNGDSVILTTDNVNGNTWSGGETTQSITVFNSDTLTVTYTDGNNCSSTSAGTAVNVNPVPSVSITSNDVSCDGDSNGDATANASGGFSPYSFLWSNSSTDSAATGLSAGTYSVTVTDANLCSSDDSITVGTATSIILADTLEYCKTETPLAVLSGSPSGGTWSGSSGVIILGSDSLDVQNTPWTIGTNPHTLYYSKSGCVDSLVLVVTGAKAGNDTSVCVNDGSFNLQAGSPSGGTWSAIGSGGLMDASTGQVDPSGLTGMVEYIYTHSGCPDTMTVTYREVAISTSFVNEGCSPGNDGSITATGNGGTSPYSYVWSDSQSTSTASALVAGTYDVTVTDNGGCTSLASITIAKDSSPVVTVSEAAVSFCVGGSDTLSASGAASYSWSPSADLSDANISNPVASPDSSVTYYVTGTTSGCSDVDSVMVTVNQLPAAPTISASGSTDICAGDNVTLTSGISTGNLWSDGSTTQSITISAAGTYSVNTTDANGCTSANSASVTVTVMPAPTISTSGSTTFCEGGSVILTSGSASGNTWSNNDTNQSITVDTTGTFFVTVSNGSCSLSSASVDIIANLLPAPVVSANDTTTFCDGGSITLTASATSGNLWSPNGETTQSITVTTSGNYSVTETDGNGCSGTSSPVAVTVNPVPSTPTISASGSTSFCSGDSVILTSSSLTDNTWSPGGETSGSIVVTSSGSYSVTVSNINNCSATSAATNVTANNPPVADAGSDVSINLGSSTTLSGSGGTSCSWSPSTSLSNANICNPSANPSSPVSYELTVTDGNGCSDIDSVTVNVVIPNPPVADFTATSVNITAGSSTNFLDLSTNSPTSWSWTFTGGIPSSSTAQNPSGIVYNTVGCYDVTLIVSNAGGSDTITKTCYVNVTTPLSCGLNAGACSTPSDSVQVGTGTSTNSNTSYPNIYGNYYWGSRHQLLYRASELQALGFSAGTIKKIGFNIASVSGTSTYTGFTIKILCTSATTLTSFQAGATTVYSQTTTIAAGWNTYTLTTPYDWDGTSNIILDVCFNNSSYINNSPTYNTSTSFNSVVEYHSDASGNCSATSANGPYTSRPNTKFLFCEQVVCPNITVSTSKTDPSCGSSTNGTASGSASGGASPYSYSWSNGATGTTISGLAPGTYAVSATDINGCTGVGVVTLTAPSAISSSVSSANSTCGNNNGSATVSAFGGSGGFTYNWSDAQTAASATGLAAGTYSVTITDMNGCSKTDSVTIADISPSVSTSATNVNCNGGNDGTATVNGSGGNTPYSYLWSDGQSAVTATGLFAGNYSVTITDNNGCTANTNTTVSEPPALIVSMMQTNVSCNGGNTGDAMAMTSGGSSPYSYLWSNGQTGQTATGLIAGNYDVTVTDNNSCTVTGNVTISEPALPLSANILSSLTTNASCNGSADGSATADASGGASPYSYLWDNGQSSASATGLGVGTYTVTATDANGCNTTTSETISEPVGISLTTSAVLANCNSSDGSATVNASGGAGGFSYLWSDGQTTGTATGLAKGNYSVTVSDANSCTNDTTVFVGEVGGLTAIIGTSNDVNCFGGNDGSAVVSGNAGTSPYSYLWNDISSTANDSVNGLSAGIYFVTVTDNAGCTDTAGVSISEPVFALAATIDSSNNVNCFGGNNGYAAAGANGGNSGYSYLWSNGETTSQISNLTSQTYDVTVTDANGCIATASVIITQPFSALSASVSSSSDVSCFGGNDGSANASASGGTSAYSFLWSDGQTASSASGLIAGTYSVTATDANGCTAISTVTISQPASVVSASIFSPTNVTCNGLCNGSATVTASGGTSGYTYFWQGGGTSATKTGMCAGTLNVTVSDANGCATTATVTISQPSALSATASSTNISCFGNSNGTATVIANGGTTGYTYLWSNSGTTATITGLAGGTYTVTVTDANSCTTTASATVSQPSALSVIISPQTNVSCTGGSNGSATAVAVGGITSYTYNWNNGASGATATGLIAGTYTVTATDANGCTANSSVTITQPASAVSVSISSQTNVNCNGGNNGSATASASGGTSGYSFLWSNGQAGASATGLIAGTYSVTSTDANGCTANTSVTISQPSAITTTTGSTPATCGNSNGTATVTPSGGNSPYTYNWSNSGTNQTISGLAAGSYNFTVTDANSCTKTGSVTVVSSGAPTVTITSNNVSCNGSANGTAAASVSGGTSPFSYLWSNGSISLTLAGLSPGSYSVTVTDANNCTGTNSMTITQPQPLIVTTSNVPNSQGAPNCNGTATAAVVGGTSAYTYFWNNGQTSPTATGLCGGAYSVTVTDANQCTQSASTTVLDNIGIEEYGNAIRVNIYPNPNDGEFSVNLENVVNGRLAVTNLLGETIYQEQINYNKSPISIDLRKLAKGIYNLQVISGEVMINRKLIIE